MCARASLRMLIFVNAMIPKPDETAGEWWSTTGATEAQGKKLPARRGYAKEFDMTTYFLHDVPHGVLRTGPERLRDEADTRRAGLRASRWPDIPHQYSGGKR